jgi:hypothetical protein
MFLDYKGDENIHASCPQHTFSWIESRAHNCLLNLVFVNHVHFRWAFNLKKQRASKSDQRAQLRLYTLVMKHLITQHVKGACPFHF